MDRNDLYIYNFFDMMMEAPEKLKSAFIKHISNFKETQNIINYDLMSSRRSLPLTDRKKLDRSQVEDQFSFSDEKMHRKKESLFRSTLLKSSAKGDRNIGSSFVDYKRKSRLKNTSNPYGFNSSISNS
mgnify:CR=1 FL=1